MLAHDDAPLSDARSETSNFMRLMPTLVVLLLSGCSVFGGSQQSCKILDPDLAQGTYRGGCKDGWADGYGEVVVYARALMKRAGASAAIAAIFWPARSTARVSR